MDPVGHLAFFLREDTLWHRQEARRRWMVIMQVAGLPLCSPANETNLCSAFQTGAAPYEAGEPLRKEEERGASPGLHILSLHAPHLNLEEQDDEMKGTNDVKQ